MALLFIDSFEHYDSASVAQKYTSGSATIYTSGGRRDGWYANPSVLRATPSPADSTIVVGVAINMATLNHTIIYIGNASGSQHHIVIKNDGSLAIQDPLGTDLAVSAAGIITTGSWYYFEYKGVLSQTVGTGEIRINGVSRLSATGLDNCYQSSTTWTWVQFDSVYIDDLYILDGVQTSVSMPNNTFLGDTTVEVIRPQTDAVAAGSNAGWTCSTGTDHGELVNDSTPDGDSTYVSAATNVKDTWNYPALSVANATIFGVQVSTSAKKSATGTAQFKNLCRPTTVDRQGTTTHAPSETSYAYYRDIWALNADDGTSVWTPSALNATEFGVERTA